MPSVLTLSARCHCSNYRNLEISFETTSWCRWTRKL